MTKISITEEKKYPNSKNPEDRKTETFRCRITKSQEEILSNNAKLANLKPSDYFRAVCCSSRENNFQSNRDEIIRLKNELKAIGRNLNQLAKYANTEGKMKFINKGFISKYNKTLDSINLTLNGEGNNES